MRKKRTTKKKMSTGAKIAVGVAVVGGGYLAWEYLVKPMINKDKPEEPKTPQEAEQQATAVINAVQQIPANTAPKNRLSPIGTPFDKINFDAKVFYGDKGAEVKFIQIYINKIRQIIGGLKQRGLISTKVPLELKTDGIYGKNTLQALEDLKMTGQGGVNSKMIVQKKKDWDKYYNDLVISYTQAGANIVNGGGSALEGAQYSNLNP